MGIDTVITNMQPRATRAESSNHDGTRLPRVCTLGAIFAKDRHEGQAKKETMETMVLKLVNEVTNLRLEIKRHEDSMNARVSHVINRIEQAKKDTETFNNKVDEMTARLEDLTSEVEDETKILENNIDEVLSKGTGMDMRESHEDFMQKMEENFEKITKRIDLWSKEFVINHKLVDLEMQAFEAKLQQNFEDHKQNTDEETETDSIEEAIDSDDSSLDVNTMIKLEVDRMKEDLNWKENPGRRRVPRRRARRHEVGVRLSSLAQTRRRKGVSSESALSQASRTTRAPGLEAASGARLEHQFSRLE